MSDYPKPHLDGDWHPSVVEDYRNARNDDERRRILREAGYDRSHRAEVERLFDGPLELEKRRKDEKKKAVIAKLKKGFAVFLKICGAAAAFIGAVEALLFLLSMI